VATKTVPHPDDAKTRTPRVVALPLDPSTPPPARTQSRELIPVGFGRLPDGPLLSPREVAERLGVRPRWVTDKHNAGHLIGYRLPGSNWLRFDWSEVVACLEKNGGD
jgi:hypothetical protein